MSLHVKDIACPLQTEHTAPALDKTSYISYHVSDRYKFSGCCLEAINKPEQNACWCDCMDVEGVEVNSM